MIETRDLLTDGDWVVDRTIIKRITLGDADLMVRPIITPSGAKVDLYSLDTAWNGQEVELVFTDVTTLRMFITKLEKLEYQLELQYEKQTK